MAEPGGLLRRFAGLSLPLLLGAALWQACSGGPLSPSGAGEVWRPAVGTSWQWQLTGTVDTSVDVDVFDLDLFDTPAGTISDLHGRGRRVICYLSAGSVEDWRPDREEFPAAVVGNPYDGWPGERWLDIRRMDLLAPVIGARLDLALSKGCDGVEPDNIDAWTNDTGFHLTAADQAAYNRWLAAAAHERGLSIGLKNDSGQAAPLEPHFDWALTEDCFAEGWCAEMSPFARAGKAVFAAEYTDRGMMTEDFCPEAERLGFSAILKNRDLDAFRRGCPEP